MDKAKTAAKIAIDFIVKHKKVFMIALVVVVVAAFALLSVIRFGGSGDDVVNSGEIRMSLLYVLLPILKSIGWIPGAKFNAIDPPLTNW